MARSILARKGTMIAFALTTLAACDRAQNVTGVNGVRPADVSFARSSGKGGGKGSGTTADQPSMTISPTQLTLSVGQQATVAVTYWDAKGSVIPVTDDKPTYYGCRKLADTDPDCWSIVSVVPGGTNNRQAAVTGKAAGTVQVYAADGLGTWVTSVVTVQ